MATTLQSLTNTAQGLLLSVGEYLTPVLTESQFLQKGVLTPEEFKLAGDELVFKCGTWTWEKGDAAYARTFLPEDKQFLMTRNVPSLRRPSYEDDSQVVEATEDDDGWLDTHSSRKNEDIEEITEIKADDDIDAEPVEISEEFLDEIAENTGDPAAEDGAESDADSVGSIPDMDSFEDRSLEEDEEDEATLQIPTKPKASKTPSSSSRSVLEEAEDTILKTRTYDVSITYDKYYQTPRIWLRGYDENQQPLTPDQIMEDISSDHAHKTATVEHHPHLPGVLCASIHPCRHADVMKKFIAMSRLDAPPSEGDAKKSDSADSKESAVDDSKPQYGLQVTEYLFLFLKFMSAVIPTIEYDYTIDA